MVLQFQPHAGDARFAPGTGADRRRHKRVPVSLLGRFMRANRQEFPCKLVDVSVGGAAMMAPIEVDVNERIVAYFDQLGGIEGHVARTFEGGFAIRIAATRHKREKLAAQLTWLINQHEPGLSIQRRHERLAPGASSANLKLADGTLLPCRLLDISISGAALRTTARPPIGDEVVLGRLRARVVRHQSNGVAVEFLDIQSPSALRRYFQ